MNLIDVLIDLLFYGSSTLLKWDFSEGSLSNWPASHAECGGNLSVIINNISWLQQQNKYCLVSGLAPYYTTANIGFSVFSHVMIFTVNSFRAINEPPHDKMTSASGEGSDQHGQRPVWWESSLALWRNIGILATHWVHSGDAHQTGRMHRLIWVFAEHICHFVGFVMMRFKYKFLKRLTWNFRAFEYTTRVFIFIFLSLRYIICSNMQRHRAISAQSDQSLR